MSETPVSETVVDFQNVTLKYRILAERGITSLKEWAIRWVTARIRYQELIALSNVSFTIPKGRAVGIIGHNGAGKSTLLRVAAGILRPTRGTAIVRGRQAPVIELGIGFEGELSGRENILFNGALLGRSPTEMEDRMEEIVEFAELSEFIEQPIRTYSTGMVARLAFSIATTVDAQILLLDEVLSVGDASFRHKCHQRLQEFRDAGVTILLVTHDTTAVENMCDQAMWIDRGVLREMGPAPEVVSNYKDSVSDETVVGGPIENRSTES